MDKKPQGLTMGAMNIIAGIYNSVRQASAVKDKAVVKFNKGTHYMCPSEFYNHRSRTFLKNKRKGL